MEVEEVYQTPESDVAISFEANAEINPYYVVSRNKFLVLYLLTMGLYELVWMYKNWMQQRTVKNENLWPIPRAIFSIFFVHQLFGRQAQDLEHTSPEMQWSAMPFATLYVVLTLINLALNFVTGDEYAAVDMVYFPLLAGTAYIVMKSQMVSNRICGDPEGKQNAGYSAVNIIFMLLGSLLWFFSLLGIAVYLTGMPLGL